MPTECFHYLLILNEFQYKATSINFSWNDVFFQSVNSFVLISVKCCVIILNIFPVPFVTFSSEIPIILILEFLHSDSIGIILSYLFILYYFLSHFQFYSSCPWTYVRGIFSSLTLLMYYWFLYVYVFFSYFFPSPANSVFLSFYCLSFIPRTLVSLLWILSLFLRGHFIFNFICKKNC